MDKHSIRAVQPGGGARKVILIALAVSLTNLSFPNFAWAGPESDPNLVKLEMKFFEHDYSKDDLTARLSRLERLVFGETKSGDPAVRLKNLVAAVPNLNETVDQSADAQNSSGSGGSGSGASDRQSSPPSRTASRQPTRSVSSSDDDLAAREKEITKSSQYPAVSAIEQKVLGHDFAAEPIAKRLDRLETKVFGKPSQSDDLSERVDLLKSRTGVDLASTPPPGTEWADDDEDLPQRGGGDITYVPANTTPFTGSRTPATNLGGSRGSSGSYGMGSSDRDGYSPGGSYGYNPPRKIASASPPRTAPNEMPPQAPDVVREPSDAPPAAMGLNQRVSLLENELFNKTYVNDTLPGRIARLENTVFPGRKTPPDMSLPERVSRLADAVGTSPGNGGSLPSKRVAQRDPDDLGDDPAMPRRAPSRSGLSKVIGGLGALLGGGGYGAYPMGNSNLITDPSTGMLVDMYSGNIIDPRTGAVVGNRSTGIQPGTFGALPYSGFNNGLSPLGAPMTSPGYGGMGMGSGMRFGTGFGGGMRFGGMGLGTGMGSGMGIWP